MLVSISLISFGLGLNPNCQSIARESGNCKKTMRVSVHVDACQKCYLKVSSCQHEGKSVWQSILRTEKLAGTTGDRAKPQPRADSLWEMSRNKRLPIDLQLSQWAHCSRNRAQVPEVPNFWFCRRSNRTEVRIEK